MSAKTRVLLVLTLAAAALAPGCRSMSSREATGAGIGTVAGAGAGYALGRHYGSRSTGTLIGAGVGGLLGYVVGDSLDESEAERSGGGYGPTPRGSYGGGAYEQGGVIVHPCPGCDDPPPPRW